VTELEPFSWTTLTARVAACRRENRRRQEAWRPAKTALALRRTFSSYPETSIAPGVSSTLSRALSAAGLHRPGLRPASLREYAANRAYARSGVEGVARLLGVESLDVAFGLIDKHWQKAYGPQVRASVE